MIGAVFGLLIERKDFFIQLLSEHLFISGISIFLAIFIGLFIGIFISEYETKFKWVLGVVNFLYTIPSISLLGFLIPFSGIGNITAIIALTIYALLPMVRNTHTGLTNINPNILEAAQGMGSTKKQILFKIKLPLAVFVIMAGVRNMVTMTIALAGIASFIGAGGLGVAIYRGITTNNPAMTIAGSLLIALLALLMDWILAGLEKAIKQRKFRKRKIKEDIILTGSILVVACMGFWMFFHNPALDAIHIATKPMTEQQIIGEMLKQVIEQETDLKVKLTHGVGGGTANIQPAMIKGDFDLYPEYTGTAWNAVLKEDGLYNENMFEQLKNQYQDNYKMTWLGMYGFNNTYGLVARKEIAEKYNLATYSDLALVADKLIFGAEYDFFEREDGFEALAEKYNYHFKKTMDLDIGLKYQAMNQGKIDVMNIFTTDGQLSVADVVVLKDDLNFYPSYMCGNIIRNQVLEQYPSLEAVLEKFSGLISDERMAQMNFEVESEGKTPQAVASEFLASAWKTIKEEG